MPGRVYCSDDLLQPISAESPGGRDLRYEPVFREILEARRSDDQLSAGAWEKEGGRKAAQWDRVADLSLEALKESSKDLRLACFLTEAGLYLDGFEGLRDCLRLTKELIYRFWDSGLLPLVEDGDLDFRASALGWLNDRMPDALRLVPITDRGGREENYSFARYLQARRIGTEDSIARLSGENRETMMDLRQQGWITMDAFEAAMKATKRKQFEALFQPFDESYENFLAFEKVVEEKFGHAAPSFTLAKEAFQEIRAVLAPLLKRKREEEPDTPAGAAPEAESAPSQSAPGAAGFSFGEAAESSSGGWQQAEALVRSGSVDRGLGQMAALAAQETSGRARFLRKLMLVDVCKTAGRERMARTILEELSKQITDFKLDEWESTALVGAVWSRLYRVYKNSEMSDEQTQAAALYNRLCQLDPWQAYRDCED
jgi:type VI secretion system protein ImpA